MALRTASVNGNWSNTATWGGNPVPVSGDTVACNVGITVTFDVDQSGFAAGLGASTWNGNLQLTTVAGSYYLKMNGLLTFGASAQYLINGGSIGTPVPQNVTYELHNNNNATTTIAFNATTVVDVVGQDSPVVKWVKLSQAEIAGATTLHVSTDVTADTNYWKNNALIHIVNINAAASADIEERTISSITSSTIVITAGLTNAKLINSYIVLISRNVKHTGNTSGGISGQVTGNWISEMRSFTAALSPSASATPALVIAGVIADAATGIQTQKNATISSIFSNLTTAGLNTPQGSVITGSFFGCAIGSAIPQGCAFVGSYFVDCPNAITQVRGEVDFINVVMDGCFVEFAITGSNADFRLKNCTLQNGGTDLNGIIEGSADNTLFGATTEFASYNSIAIRHCAPWAYVESLNHDATAGAFRSWTLGGIVSSVATPTYDGSRVRSYNLVCESATYAGFFQRKVLVPSGGTLALRIYARKDTAMSYVPRVWVFEDWKHPLAIGSPDLEILMTDNQDTWQVLTGSITNSSDSEKTYIIQFLGKNASGNVYFDPLLRVSSYAYIMGDI